MNVMMSEFLIEKRETVRRLVCLLRKRFAYASVLGTDVSGKRFVVSDKTTSVSDSPWAERGFVVRVFDEGRYFEYSLNELADDGLEELVEKIEAYARKSASEQYGTYPMVEEDEISASFFDEVKILPDERNSKEKLAILKEMNEKAHTYSELLVDFTVIYSEVKVSKIFISEKKDLQQAYIWSESYLIPLVRKGDVTRNLYCSCSGLKGLEVLDELESNIEKIVFDACLLLDAEPIPPGDYEVICSPLAVGVIAHEAFGHGVEMDMFVKERAKGAYYMDKPVASAIVNMRDGAMSARNVSSYYFDDEGTLGSDTLVIDKGILKSGISDLLSAFKLGTKPTGNGKRQNFEHKAYTRMTNTFFEPGTDTLEDMIASIPYGCLLEVSNSGMEDPKDWGIQVMFAFAREIVKGKLTGRVFAPVIMTGYVPDLLQAITMVSDDFQMEGSGACGKGHKEWVKVSDGGPYIKTKARLG